MRGGPRVGVVTLAIAGAFVVGDSGCGSVRDLTMRTRADQADARVPASRADLASALLFDRKPGPFRASDFAFRSDWPSTVSFYSPGQVISFAERFVDFQGRGFGESDYTYRRFDTYRAGIGFR